MPCHVPASAAKPMHSISLPIELGNDVPVEEQSPWESCAVWILNA